MSLDLIMPLTGESRETQVQPPLGAWTGFFQFDPNHLGKVKLKSAKSKHQIQRPIVRHDHNWTLEIPESAGSRPAIIRFRRLASSKYRYWIYRPADPDFEFFDSLLKRYRDPSWISGRPFVILHSA